MPTEAQIEAWLAKGEQFVKDELAKLPFRPEPTFEDMMVALKAMMRHLLSSSPHDEPEPPPALPAPEPPPPANDEPLPPAA